MGREKKRKQFLVVEDEFLIAILLEDYLEDLGYEVAYKADTIDGALKLIESGCEIDGAILDMNIHGAEIDPIADALRAREVPFCFITGYGPGVQRRYVDVPLISKPFNITALRDTLGLLMSGPATRDPTPTEA